jgi:YesN/AraC family two-component response regulator
MSPFELNREDFHKITENMGDNLFRLKEARILFLKKGSMRNLLNFEEYEIQERTLTIFPPNFNIEDTNISTDFSAEIIALKETFFESEDMIKLFSTIWSNPYILQLNEEEFRMVEKYFSLTRDLLNTTFSTSIKLSLQHLLNSFILNIKTFSGRSIEKDIQSPYKISMFQRFISLVKEHYKQERTIGFYANQLSITPHYLSALIKQTSGETVMQWINKMVILKSKELLREGNLLVYEISNELNFPNPSFFSRFFKKQTGITPFQYQKQNFKGVIS